MVYFRIQPGMPVKASVGGTAYLLPATIPASVGEVIWLGAYVELFEGDDAPAVLAAADEGNSYEILETGGSKWFETNGEVNYMTVEFHMPDVESLTVCVFACYVGSSGIPEKQGGKCSFTFTGQKCGEIVSDTAPRQLDEGDPLPTDMKVTVKNGTTSLNNYYVRLVQGATELGCSSSAQVSAGATGDFGIILNSTGTLWRMQSWEPTMIFELYLV